MRRCESPPVEEGLCQQMHAYSAAVCTLKPSYRMFSKNKRPYDPETLPPVARLRRNVTDLFAGNDIAAPRAQDH